MPDMNENSETQQEYFGRANASRMSVEEREKTILLQQLSDREKRIVELEMTVGTLRTFSNEQATCIERFEKENKVLAQNLEDTEILNKTYEKRFDDLKKENAELRTDYEVLSCSVGDFGELQNKLEEEQRKNNGLSDNLTKAKEIISEYIDILKGDTMNWKKTQEKAERFLNIEK